MPLDRSEIDLRNAQINATRKLAEATLAAAIVQVRGSATAEVLKDALTDAHHLLFPDTTSGRHIAWLTKHGLQK